jgi:hypothetical protein
MQVLLDRPFGKAQVIGNLLVGFRLADQRHDLLLAERELGVLGRLRDRYRGFAASRATILSSGGAKTRSTACATPRGNWRRILDFARRHKFGHRPKHSITPQSSGPPPELRDNSSDNRMAYGKFLICEDCYVQPDCQSSRRLVSA